MRFRILAVIAAIAGVVAVAVLGVALALSLIHI